MKYIKIILSLFVLLLSYWFFIDTDNKREAKMLLRKHSTEKKLAASGFGADRSPVSASIRKFLPEVLPESVYLDIADKARMSPSACNRQPIKMKRVFRIEDAMQMHGGLKDGVYNLIAITGDVNYYIGPGERYQVYVDGGIFLMNVLTAIRHMGFGACPLHWCADYSKDRKMRKILHLKRSEKIIAFVSFGVIHPDAKMTPSIRRRKEEIYEGWNTDVSQIT